MAVWVNSVGLFLLTLILHIIIWRIRLPRRQTKSLLLLFLGVMTANLFVGFFPTYELKDWVSQTQTVIIYTALVLGYVITYSALEADSPSLVMILSIYASGDKGFPISQMEQIANNETLVLPRLQDLVRDKHATFENGVYRLTQKGRRFISIFIFYRKLLGAQVGG